MPIEDVITHYDALDDATLCHQDIFKGICENEECIRNHGENVCNLCTLFLHDACKKLFISRRDAINIVKRAVDMLDKALKNNRIPPALMQLVRHMSQKINEVDEKYMENLSADKIEYLRQNWKKIDRFDIRTTCGLLLLEQGLSTLDFRRDIAVCSAVVNNLSKLRTIYERMETVYNQQFKLLVTQRLT